MKKVFFSTGIALAIIAASCEGGKSESTASNIDAQSATPAATGVANDPVYKEGLALVEGTDCGTCHKLNSKLQGPSYLDIANKYEDNEKNIAMLADKVIKGGTGVWDQAVMTAHVGLSTDDAKKMVKYILLTKKL